MHREEIHPATVSDWFARRTYSHDQFADVDQLSERKRELDLSLTVVLPARGGRNDRRDHR